MARITTNASVHLDPAVTITTTTSTTRGNGLITIGAPGDATLTMFLGTNPKDTKILAERIITALQSLVGEINFGEPATDE